MNPLGIYVHIPFCKAKCGYCDFYSLCDGSLMDEYMRAVTAHIRETGLYIKTSLIDTIYIGGGTPTHFGAKRVAALLDLIRKTFPISTNVEITVEANPESIGFKGMQKLKRAGANRLSIGVQTANNAELEAIGRLHTFETAVDALECAGRAGFNNISLDLMYGLPGQTLDSWLDSVRKVIELKPQHISCYGLKLGIDSRMGPSPIDLPCDDIQADMYLEAVKLLACAGYGQYEISNFSLPSRESRHNLKYWTLSDYIGFGPSAHSDFNRHRYSIVSDLGEYIAGIKNNGAVIDNSEYICTADRAAEYLMLRLRTTAGISSNEYCRLFKATFEPIETTLIEAMSRGHAVCENDRWHLTPEGFLVSNSIISDVLESINY